MSFVYNSVNTVIRANRGLIFKYRSAVNNANISNFNVCKHFFSSNSVDDTFKMAVTQVAGLRSEPGNEVKLKLYALYKQATVGPCNADKPGMFDVVAKYKWEAWSKLGNKSKEESMEDYIKLVESLIKSIGLVESEAQNDKEAKPSTSSPEGMVITNKQGVLTLRLNRPEKKNALLTSMYHEITKNFNDAAKDDSVKMVVLTGTGDYFSSGNDLTNFQIKPTDDIAKLAKDSAGLLEDFVNAFIDFPKPLLAVVNGPAFGIMVTTLALCDNVICSDKATFQTPFLSTSQTPEGCSTYTFPRIMGTAKANAMLLFNQSLTAQEALQCGLVSKVIPHDQLDSYLDGLLYGNKGLLSFGSTITWRMGKPLIRTEEEKQIMKKINRIECLKLAETWLSPDFTQAMMKFFTRKK
ncbi:enoyl-CoA delta isomerase 2, mitochondrial isoform X2 [Tetranychus urticae]|uniref:ACB domain-containing protein n=1 Tax=Tetranychus urticae TaxID=32264 RepID=T1JVV9_TETUR|nr:enoyl-CoA delta isomerase 2, mitochondrial isoform X2 [Tetranychus urticae]